MKTIETLLTHELHDLFTAWGNRQPPRLGLRASSLLVSEEEWCTRQHILAEITPPEKRNAEDHTWKTNAVFLHGWQLHQKWQYKLLEPSGMVQTYREEYGPGNFEIGPELDHTHIDKDRGIGFSPDAIIEYAGELYIVEIKGINTLDFQGCPNLYERSYRNGAYEYKLVHEARPGIKNATLEEAMKANKSIRGAVPQANLYMHLTGIKHAIILVEDKNTQEFKLWVLDYNQEPAWPYTRRAEQVKVKLALYHIEGWLPVRVCSTANDPRARRCPLRDVCFSINEEKNEEEEPDYE